MRSEGWYSDPFNKGQQRYWDGKQWSTQVRPDDSQDISGRLKGAAAKMKKRVAEAGTRVQNAAREASAEKVISTTCASCGTSQDVVIGGGIEGALRATGVVGGALVAGTAGATVGTVIGIASHGTAIAGTVPLAAAGAVGGALAGDRVGDAVASHMRSTKCSACGKPLIVARSSPDSDLDA